MRNHFILFTLLLWFPFGLNALTWEKMAIEVSPKDDDIAVTADFHYTNKTDRPVTITRASGSCSECTTLFWDKKEIAPGESGILVASVKVAGINGRKTKYITVTTTEKKPFPDRLSLTVIMPEKLRLSEKKLKWGHGEKMAKSITIETTLPDAAPYIDRVFPANIFKVSLTPDGHPARGHVLTVTPLEGDGPPRRASVRIGVQTPDGVEYFENLSIAHY